MSEPKGAASSLQAKLDALKARTFKAPQALLDEAEIARQINAETERLDKEGAEALDAYAEQLEAEARERHPGQTVRAVYSWTIHKATATDQTTIESVLKTGRGLIIVKGATGKAAVKCAAAFAASGPNGRACFYINRPEDVAAVLRNAAVYPDTVTMNEWLADAERSTSLLPSFLVAAAREASDLAGTLAETTAGKSRS